MQRSAVLLPEPLRPMIAGTSPRPTSNDDAVQHLQRAEALVHVAQRHDRRSVADAFIAACQAGARLDLPAPHAPLQLRLNSDSGIAEREIDDGDDRVDHERLEQRVVDDLARPRQLDEADDRGERGVLDDLHHEADRRRRRDPDRLRQDHLDHALGPAQRQALRPPPIAGAARDSMQPRQISPRKALT